MPRMTLVRYATKPECADENEALSRAVYKELRAKAPAHIAYTLFRAETEFVHMFINTKDDSSDPVTELPSFKSYQQNILSRCMAPPEIIRLNFSLVDAYGLKEEWSSRLHTMEALTASPIDG